MPRTNKTVVVLELTLFGKYDTSKTTTIRLTNQSALKQKTPVESYPCLLSVTGVGVEQNEFYPKNRTGNVVLDNSRHAIAFQKRITDLAGGYVIQGAAASIYVACVLEDDEDVEADLELTWQGQIRSVNYNTNATRTSQKLSLSLGRDEEEHTISRVIRRDDFPDVPDRSKNKYMPIVLGFDQQVTPYPLEEAVQEGVNGTKLQFGYATNMEGVLGNQFRNIGIQKILAKDISKREAEFNKYFEVQSAVDMVTPVYKQIQIGPIVGTVPDLAKPRGFWIPYFPGFTASPNHIVTGIRLFVQGNSSGAPEIEGELSIRLHRQRVNAQRPQPPSKGLAEAVVVKSDYLSDWVGGAIFAVEAVFDEPVPIVDDGTYWISVQGSSENDPNNITLLPIIDANPGVVPGIVTHWATTEDTLKDNDDSWVEEKGYGPTQTTASFELLGLVVGDFPDGDGTKDNDGLGFSYADLRYDDFSDTHPAGAQQMEDLSRVDLILEIDGLKDVTGAVTGVPGFILGNPTWQLDALFHTYDGTTWNPGTFNPARFAASHTQYIDIDSEFFRETAGRSYGKTTNIDIIKELGRNSYSTITYDGIGGIAEYSILAVGQTRSPSLVIKDDEALIERWSVNDLSYVVNTLDANYSRRLDNIHFQSSLDQEQFRDYSKTYRTHPRDGGVGQTYSEKSFFHYKERRLRDENFDYIFSDSSADSVANLFLRLHDHPAEYAQVLLPYCRYRQSVRMLDVVQINSTEMPTIHGTSPRTITEDDDCRLAGGPTSKARPVVGVVQAITFTYEERGQVFLRVLVRLATQENDPMINYIPETF
jgi:hypothetical protein